jgi:hypothetical protein
MDKVRTILINREQVQKKCWAGLVSPPFLSSLRNGKMLELLSLNLLRGCQR